MAGYSATPLARKLGLRPGMRAWFADLPDSVRADLLLDQIGVEELDAPTAGLDYAHLFCRTRAAFESRLAAVRPLIAPAGAIWASWPKRAAKIATDLSENVIRDVALPLGLVDIKVCAVDEIWSGLKLVIPVALR